MISSESLKLFGILQSINFFDFIREFKLFGFFSKKSFNIIIFDFLKIIALRMASMVAYNRF